MACGVATRKLHGVHRGFYTQHFGWVLFGEKHYYNDSRMYKQWEVVNMRYLSRNSAPCDVAKSRLMLAKASQWWRGFPLCVQQLPVQFHLHSLLWVKTLWTNESDNSYHPWLCPSHTRAPLYPLIVVFVSSATVQTRGTECKNFLTVLFCRPFAPPTFVYHTVREVKLHGATTVRAISGKDSKQTHHVFENHLY